MNELDLHDDTMIDEVFWSDSSDNGGQDLPELTSSEESDSDDLPDLVGDLDAEDQEVEELADRVAGQSGRWWSARMSWWGTIRRGSRSDPWLLDDVILPSSDLINE